MVAANPAPPPAPRNPSQKPVSLLDKHALRCTHFPNKILSEMDEEGGSPEGGPASQVEMLSPLAEQEGCLLKWVCRKRQLGLIPTRKVKF